MCYCFISSAWLFFIDLVRSPQMRSHCSHPTDAADIVLARLFFGVAGFEAQTLCTSVQLYSYNYSFICVDSCNDGILPL